MSDGAEPALAETIAALGLSEERSPRTTIGRAATVAVGAAELDRTTQALPRLALVDPSAATQSHFELERLGTLGEGGMGVVDLAHQQVLDRPVAVKYLRPEANLPQAVERLLAEARITGQLEHPNIVPIHAVGKDPERGPIVVMKRVEGKSWQEEVAERPALARDEHLRDHLSVLRTVSNALHFAHSHGVIHRDVKLENVMLGAFGEVYVVDWGVALKLDEPDSQDAQFVGTVCHMAPEMVSVDPRAVDVRTDVFLLGATLHELLVGEPRNSSESLMHALRDAASCQPYEYPPSVPVELADICRRACARDPDQRFQTAEELSDALRAYLGLRDARTLESAARAHHDELKSLIGSRSDDAPIQESMLAARIGYEQALRLRPDLDGASDRLQELHADLFDYELVRENLIGARRAFEALQTPTEDQRERLRALEGSTRATRERLAFLEYEHDTSLSTKQRRWLAYGLTSAFLAYFAMSLVRGRTEPDLERMMYVGAGIWAVGCAMIVAFRKRLAANAVNRRLAVTVFLLLTGAVLNRVNGVSIGSDPLAVAVNDMVLLAFALGHVRAFMRTAYPLAMLCLSVVVGIVAAPELVRGWVTLVFNGTVALTGVACAWEWGRSGRGDVSRSKRTAGAGTHP